MADNRPRLARATRFFARPVSFDLECPACGVVYQIRSVSNQRKKARPANFDWTTSRFTCPECKRSYIIGILAWPVGRNSRIDGTPRDQVPNMRQLAGLRREGSGWWLSDEDRIRRPIPDETNLTTEDDRKVAETKYADDVDED